MHPCILASLPTSSHHAVLLVPHTARTRTARTPRILRLHIIPGNMAVLPGSATRQCLLKFRQLDTLDH